MTPAVALPALNCFFTCREGESVLDAMRSVHHTCIGAGCRNGGCGVCKIRILSGAYTTGLMSSAHVSAADREQGIVLACRAYPVGEVYVEIVGALPKKMARQFGFLVKQ